MSSAAVRELADRVRAASAARRPLRIRAGGSKDFYGNPVAGEILDPRGCAGVTAYEPSELVLTAQAGTRLAEIDELLLASGQMLAFEPPQFSPAATLGGCVAAGLAGPRRALAGGVRDALLGAKLLDGRGNVLAFGGTVMKNVAGYDVSRLLAGSLGTLGVLLEVSLKVVPRPPFEATLALELDERTAHERCLAWLRAPWPLSASAWHAGRLWVRLSGARSTVLAACAACGGERLAPSAALEFWEDVREQRLPLFTAGPRLWRVSVPGNSPELDLPGAQLIEWGGSLRWLATDLGAAAIRTRATALGGHATLFRGGDGSIPVFQPLAPVVARIETRLRAEFDPAGIFNPGRMHADATR